MHWRFAGPGHGRRNANRSIAVDRPVRAPSEALPRQAECPGRCDPLGDHTLHERARRALVGRTPEPDAGVARDLDRRLDAARRQADGHRLRRRDLEGRLDLGLDVVLERRDAVVEARIPGRRGDDRCTDRRDQSAQHLDPPAEVDVRGQPGDLEIEVLDGRDGGRGEERRHVEVDVDLGVGTRGVALEVEMDARGRGPGRGRLTSRS